MLNLTLTLRKRLFLFLCIAVIGFFITAVISALLLYKFSATTAVMRISTIFQDLAVFILPAVLTAVMVTRQPADLLCLRGGIPWPALFIGLFVVVVSAPAMNLVIWLNSHLPLPQDVIDMIQSFEDQANQSVSLLMGAHDIPNLIMSVLIVGLLAGFSEEIFFRGAFQRLLSTGGIGTHAAIWISAFVFSLLHMQFFGFVPRMLLGALFGYALVWTKSLWVPVIMHAFNNALYVIFQWRSMPEGSPSPIDTVGVSGNTVADALMICASVVLVVIGLRYMYLFRNWRVRSLPR